MNCQDPQSKSGNTVRRWGRQNSPKSGNESSCDVHVNNPDKCSDGAVRQITSWRKAKWRRPQAGSLKPGSDPEPCKDRIGLLQRKSKITISYTREGGKYRSSICKLHLLA